VFDSFAELRLNFLFMSKPYLTIVVAAALSVVSLSPAAGQGSAPSVLNAVVDLTFNRTIWDGAYYVSFLTVRATESEQTSEDSATGLVKGSAATVRFGNKAILAGKKGRLVAVWDGPAGLDYPFLAAYEKKGVAPVKCDGWHISSLYVEDPEDSRSTVNGAIRVKQSQNLVVPATDNPNVPKNEKAITGYTKFTFGIKDTTPTDAIQGWGKFTANFRKLFTGNARLSGSVDQVP